ncbi:MAG TPA: hypothetical protein VNT81_02150 [Vicinamibacterales bacterium]|nr:hypothetical protein [Vicinamibacterales bacterium]
MTLFRQGHGAQAPDCPHEQHVVNAVLAGSWPERCDENLVTHAAACQTCKEVASVSILLREDVDSSRIEVQVPAAGQVWWRAAVRARLESTQAATRPIGWMHAITAAMVAGVFLAIVTAVWPMVPGVLQTLRSASAEFFPSTTVATAIAGGLAQTVLIGVVAAALLLLAPLAVYFVLSDD